MSLLRPWTVRDPSRFVALLLVSFVSLVCIYIFFLDPWGHDLWFHLHRLQDLQAQLRAGRLRAYLSGNLVGGKGLPVYVYYSQWVYWPPLLLRQMGVSTLVALKLVFCLFVAASCLGTYRLLLMEGARTVAALGALLFATSNYFIGDVFVRSAYPEFLSYSLLPLLLLSLRHVLIRGGPAAEISMVAVASLMILFHPLSFMNSGLAVAAYALHVARASPPTARRVAKLGVLFALALGLTAFYWLPAVIETKYVLGAQGMPVRIDETFMSVGRYLKFASVTNLGLVLSASSAVVVGWLVLCAARGRMGPLGRAWPLAACAVTYIVLMLPSSRLLWTSLPFIAANIFAWRLLFPLLLLLVLIVATGLATLPEKLRSPGLHAVVACVAVVQAAGFVLWHTSSDISMRRLTQQEIEQALAVESRRTHGWGIDEYRPNPRTVPTLTEPCRDVGSVDGDGSYTMRFTITADDANHCIHVERFWNLRYSATVDGHATPVYADRDGEIAIAPRGRAGVATIRFNQPRYVPASMLVSTLAALLLMILAAVPRQGNFVGKGEVGRRS